MKIVVDMAVCQNHGQCAISAPDNFELDVQGKLNYNEAFDDDSLVEIEDAVDSCPVQAILLSPNVADGR